VTLLPLARATASAALRNVPRPRLTIAIACRTSLPEAPRIVPERRDPGAINADDPGQVRWETRTSQVRMATAATR
jgi:hypothetical protein